MPSDFKLRCETICIWLPNELRPHTETSKPLVTSLSSKPSANPSRRHSSDSRHYLRLPTLSSLLEQLFAYACRGSKLLDRVQYGGKMIESWPCLGQQQDEQMGEDGKIFVKGRKGTVRNSSRTLKKPQRVYFQAGICF